MEWIPTPTTGRQPEPRSFHTCTAVGNRVVVFGGRSPENVHFGDLHIFDIGIKKHFLMVLSHMWGRNFVPENGHTVHDVP